MKPHTIAHEFGHFVDLFAKPDFMYQGFACTGDENCQASCKEDTTDESWPLSESWSDLAATWYLTNLLEDAGDFEHCESLGAINQRSPHNETCIPLTKCFSVLLREDDPNCPVCESGQARCDKPNTPGFEEVKGEFVPTGICSKNQGYHTASFTQALWELLHAEECGESQPYECEPLPALMQASPKDVVGEALLYAVRVDTATYRGFADDMMTYISCNYGESAYSEANAVFCHHGLRRCGAPAPLLCETCMNGIREGGEDCDQTDLGGESCAGLGFDDGTLSCTAECTFDTSMCNESEPTTTGGATSTGTTGTEPPDGNCQCNSANTSPPLWTGILALLAFRRRRSHTPASSYRALTTLFVAIATCFLFACKPATGSDSDPDSDSDSDSSTSDTGSGYPTTVDPRFFGYFHGLEVGYVGQTTPDGALNWVGWGQIQILPDNTFTHYGYMCASLTDTTTLKWEYLPDEGAISLIPNSPEGIRIGFGILSSYKITLDEACDGVIVDIDDTKNNNTVIAPLHRGRVCTEGDSCDYFEVIWCGEGDHPPVCYP